MCRGAGRPLASLLCLGLLLITAAIVAGEKAADAAAPVTVAAAMASSSSSSSSSSSWRGRDEAFLDSKRRVPNGPDPIHNRRAGRFGRPPVRA